MPSYISTPNSFLSWQLATIATSIWTVSSVCLVLHNTYYVNIYKLYNNKFKKKHCFVWTRNTLLSWQKKEILFSLHKKYFVISEKERNIVFYAQETLYCLGRRKKHCFLCTRNTLFSKLKKETRFCVQETLSCLCKWKKYCFLCRVDILFSVQRKEIMFSFDKKHFVVCAKERNTVLYAQEMLCCQCKRKKHCFLCTVNTLLFRQTK